MGANHRRQFLRNTLLALPAAAFPCGRLFAAADASLANDVEAVTGDGRQILLKFGARLACMQDLKVVFEDNDAEAVLVSLDMCSIDKLSLKFDATTRTTIALKL